MRRDALERREALIGAAIACFTERGFAVPLEEIADRAGVGRGTLYRNFKDRMALTLAIFAREIDRMAERLDPDLSVAAAISAAVRGGREAAALFGRLATEISLSDEDMAAFRALGDRLEGMLEPIVARARARGEVRADLTAKDVAIAIRMASGLMMRRLPKAELDTQLDQALELLMRGYRAA
ncbi:helix-turn-helix domain containing protein [Sphingomonas naphthae]|uniref:Helix-turn-helix domain containing protein n=1 Tax=Sphingomonas naphthae TaxID=1813468 RepID=A0ABY7TMT9_9SPHN|nr:TetR/AcrR family transcriptional regulator [Sphingomonas naphthae]WCT74066.1 helix-turn-helix domain containing protein [Sphingomonas naphthae]